MNATLVAALLTSATTFITTYLPQLIALAEAAKVGASETDIAKIDAALAGLQPANDALHAKVQGL